MARTKGKKGAKAKEPPAAGQTKQTKAAKAAAAKAERQARLEKLPQPGDAPFKDPTTGVKDTYALVNAISESTALTNALFPLSGQNVSTAEGGGMKKSEAYFECVVKLWGTRYPEYIKMLKEGPKMDREGAANKIKYELTRLIKETQRIKKQMHGTGSGNEMTQQQLDELDADDERRSAWGPVLEDFPWYFSMRTLLSDRPNHEPVSLGNTDSDDITLVAGFSVPPSDDALSQVPELTGSTRSPSPAEDDDDDADDNESKKRKRRTSRASSTIDITDDEDNTQTATQPKVDTKPDIKPATKKPKYASDLAELASAEERTQQKRLDVAIKDIDAERARARADEVHSREVLGPKARAALLREQRKAENDAHKRNMELLEARAKFGDSLVNSTYGTSFGVPMGSEFDFPDLYLPSSSSTSN